MGKHILVKTGFPEKDVLSALGRLVIMQGHLEYELKMTLKSLLGISIKETLEQNSKTTAKQVREKIIKTAKEKLEAGETLNELLALIKRAWKAADTRNQYVHNVWARINTNQLYLQTNDHKWQPAPTKDEIENLTDEISSILVILNQTRLSRLNK